MDLLFLFKKNIEDDFLCGNGIMGGVFFVKGKDPGMLSHNTIPNMGCFCANDASQVLS